MSLVKVNNYQQGIQDISNMAENVDYLRKGIDLSFVEFTGGNYFAKVGSIIEYDGDTYVIQDSDEQITGSISSTLTNYILFDGLTFVFTTSTPVYDNAKNGYYISGDRVIRMAVFDSAICNVEFEARVFNDSIEGDLTVNGTFTADKITSNGDVETISDLISSGSTSDSFVINANGGDIVQFLNINLNVTSVTSTNVTLTVSSILGGVSRSQTLGTYSGYTGGNIDVLGANIKGLYVGASPTLVVAFSPAISATTAINADFFKA